MPLQSRPPASHRRPLTLPITTAPRLPLQAADAVDDGKVMGYCDIEAKKKGKKSLGEMEAGEKPVERILGAEPLVENTSDAKGGPL